MNAPIRVFQVATGNVGSEMIKRIATQPDLELVGVHCYSPEKIGKDAGELAGGHPTGEGHRHRRGNHRRQAGRAHLPRRVPRRGPLRQGARGGHQCRHHRRLDHRLAPRQEPSAPVGQAGEPVAGRRLRQRRRDVLRDRDEPGPEPDTGRGVFGRRRRHRERHHHRVRRRLVPPLQGHLDRGGLRPAGRRPGDPGRWRSTPASSPTAC